MAEAVSDAADPAGGTRATRPAAGAGIIPNRARLRQAETGGRTMPDAADLLTQNDLDRRDYFRVNDLIALRVDALADTGDVSVPDSLQAGQTLLRELHQIEADNALLLRTISDKHRDIGQYLKSQTRRIELVARFFVLQHAAALYRNEQVSLSGSGIGWTTTQPLPVGAGVAVHFILLQSAVAVSCRARVIASEALADSLNGARAVRVEFTDISDADRDAVVRHCLHVQASQRREQREQSS